MLRSSFLQPMLIKRGKMMIMVDNMVEDLGGDMVIENMRECTLGTHDWAS